MKKIENPGLIAIAYIIFSAINIAIKSMGYPTIALLSENFWVGIFYMFLLSISIRSIILITYYITNIDWLFIIHLKNDETYKENSITKIILKCRKKGALVLLFILIFVDPVAIFLYYNNNKNEFKGILINWVWLLFIISNIACVSTFGGLISLLINYLKT